MALSLTEIEAITNDYFMTKGGKAVDIYFKASLLLKRWMEEKKGLFERPAGGHKIRIPLNYSNAEGGFFSRSDPLSSDDRVSINAAHFLWKHAYGNATVLLTDELENSGEYAEVQMVTQKIENAQKTCRDLLAQNLYSGAGDSAKVLTGLLSLCNTTTSLAYGGIATDDLVSADGTKPWEGKVNTNAEAVSLQVIQTLRSDAKIADGPGGKPNVISTTESLYSTISRILLQQQRFTQDTDTAKSGFQNLVFEGAMIFPDDYCPDGYAFALNEEYVGFAVHQKGLFVRDSWMDLESQLGRTMKIRWHGNLICSNRKAHKAHSNLS